MKALLKKMLPPSVITGLKHLRLLPWYARGCAFAHDWKERSAGEGVKTGSREPREPSNPLWTYFANHTEGPGIWKWEHYFEIYHRHLSKFVGGPVKVLEIGIYSGGSLDMWESYFGKDCHIYGVDIEKACKAYEREKVTVFIGDQEDLAFWARFNAQVRGIDVLIDDGGHMPNQQMVTLREMLPHLNPGGVYICEDIHGIDQGFASFVSGLVAELNETAFDGEPGCKATPFQAACHSVHFYPYVVVIEKHARPPSRFVAPKHGTQWQPFVVQ